MTTPLPGFTVTTPYGTPGSWAAGYHTGEDYSTHGATGERVQATTAGRVVGVGNVWGSDYGKQVVVESGGIRHGYCHLSGYAVKAGQQVQAGDKLGGSGNTGNSTGPHLHYEERRAPFGYHDHRDPVFSHQADDDDQEGDDVPEYVSLSGPGMTVQAGADWAPVKMSTESSDAGDVHPDGYAWLNLSGARYVGQLRLVDVERENDNTTAVIRWAEYDQDSGRFVSAPALAEYPLTSGTTGVHDHVIDSCSKGNRIRPEVKARGGRLVIGSAGLTALYWR